MKEISNEDAAKIYQKFLDDYKPNIKFSKVSNVSEYILLRNRIKELYDSKDYIKMEKYIAVFREEIDKTPDKMIKLIQEFSNDSKVDLFKTIDYYIDELNLSDEINSNLNLIKFLFNAKRNYSSSTRQNLLIKCLDKIQELGFETDYLRRKVDNFFFGQEVYENDIVNLGKEKVINDSIASRNKSVENLVKVKNQYTAKKASEKVTGNLKKLYSSIYAIDGYGFQENAQEGRTLDNSGRVSGNSFVFGPHVKQIDKESFVNAISDATMYEIEESNDEIEKFTNKQEEFVNQTTKYNENVKSIFKSSKQLENLKILLKNSKNVFGEQSTQADNVIKSLIVENAVTLSNEKEKNKEIKEEFSKVEKEVNILQEETISKIEGRPPVIPTEEINEKQNIESILLEVKRRAQQRKEEKGKEEKEEEEKIPEDSKKQKEEPPYIENNYKEKRKLFGSLRRKLAAVVGAGTILFAGQAADAVNMQNEMNKINETSNSSLTLDLGEAVYDTYSAVGNISIEDFVQKIKTSNDPEIKIYRDFIDNMNVNYKSSSQKEEIQNGFLYSLGALRNNWEKNAVVLGLDESWQNRIEKMVAAAESIRYVGLVDKSDVDYAGATYFVGYDFNNEYVEFNTHYNGQYTSVIHELEHVIQLIPNTLNVEELKKYLGQVPNAINLGHVLREGGANLVQNAANKNYLSQGFTSYSEINSQFMSLMLYVGPNEFLDFMTINAGESFDNYIKRMRYPNSFVQDNLKQVQGEYINQISKGREGILSYSKIMGYTDDYYLENLSQIQKEYNEKTRNSNLFEFYVSKNGLENETLNNKEKIQKDFIDLCSSNKENFVEFVMRRTKEQGLTEKDGYEFLDLFEKSTVGTLTYYDTGTKVNNIDFSNTDLNNISSNYKTQISNFNNNPEKTYEKSQNELSNYIKKFLDNQFEKASTDEEYIRIGYKYGLYFDQVVGEWNLNVKNPKASSKGTKDELAYSNISNSVENKTKQKEECRDDVADKMWTSLQYATGGDLELKYDEFLDIYDEPGQASNYIESAKLYSEMYVTEREIEEAERQEELKMKEEAAKKANSKEAKVETEKKTETEEEKQERLKKENMQKEAKNSLEEAKKSAQYVEKLVEGFDKTENLKSRENQIKTAEQKLKETTEKIQISREKYEKIGNVPIELSKIAKNMLDCKSSIKEAKISLQNEIKEQERLEKEKQEQARLEKEKQENSKKENIEIDRDTIQKRATISHIKNYFDNFLKYNSVDAKEKYLGFSQKLCNLLEENKISVDEANDIFNRFINDKSSIDDSFKKINAIPNTNENKKEGISDEKISLLKQKLMENYDQGKISYGEIAKMWKDLQTGKISPKEILEIIENNKDVFDDQTRDR